METFWTPNDEQLLGLANGYHDDPRFRANFDKIDPNLAGFIREAVKAYVKKGHRFLGLHRFFFRNMKRTLGSLGGADK